MAFSQILHYRIEKKLGKGGMGEVYLATDTHLDRPVALKFLPDEIEKNPEARDRLLREAKAASKLSHPSIMTIYSVEQDKDRRFIVMEYLEGETLSQISAQRELTQNEILDLVIRIGEGLQSAHERGVIHRDIKPDNIMVCEGDRIKIADFGLARWQGATTITKMGTFMGTPYYMSPEQARREQVDHRSDLFSLGVILYELLCKRRPFEGESAVLVLHELLDTEPQPLARYYRGATAELQRIVAKTLAKQRDHRYQSAADLVADLRALRASGESGLSVARTAALPPGRRLTPFYRLMTMLVLIAAGATLVWQMLGKDKTGITPQPIRLAVLPFENLGSQEDEPFAAGITEAVTMNLARIQQLGVTSRYSTLKYKNAAKSLKEIGTELKVDYLLAGTIHWEQSDASGRVRIDPQLVRVVDDTYVWGESYVRVLDRIFDLQAEIAKAVVAALHVVLLDSEKKFLDFTPTTDLRAQDFYLRGLGYFSSSWEEEDIRIAVEMFGEAVQLDSNFALAHAMLARAHASMYLEYYDHSEERKLLAHRAALLALQLEPDLPEAHYAQGYYYYHCESDYERALEEFAIAQEGQPSNSDLTESAGRACTPADAKINAATSIQLRYVKNLIGARLVCGKTNGCPIKHRLCISHCQQGQGPSCTSTGCTGRTLGTGLLFPLLCQTAGKRLVTRALYQWVRLCVGN